MSNQDNTTGSQVGIETEDGTKNVDPKLLTEYKNEAFEHLTAVKKATTLFKETVEVLSDKTGIKKNVLSKWLKTRFKDKVRAMKAETETVEALDAAVNPEN